MTRNDVLGTLSKYLQSRQGEYGILRLGVFGSAARDELTGRSDVDVVVELARPDLFTLVGIKQELEGLLQRNVDVVRYRGRMNALLKERIEREAVYV